jgi:hypothetical protein
MLKNKKLPSLELKDLVCWNKMLLDYLKIYMMLKNVLNINLKKIYPKKRNEILV